MASEIRADQRAVPERKPLKELPSGVRPTQQGGPPMNDGPEAPRSNHC